MADPRTCSPSLHATIVCNGIQTDMPTKPSQTKQSKVSKMWSKGYSKITKKAADKGSDAVADQGKSYAQDQVTSAMSSSSAAQSGAAGTGASASASAGGAATQATSGEGGAAWRKPFKKAYEEHFGMRDLFALKIDPDDFAALGSSLEHFTRECVTVSFTPNQNLLTSAWGTACLSTKASPRSSSRPPSLLSCRLSRCQLQCTASQQSCLTLTGSGVLTRPKRPALSWQMFSATVFKANAPSFS